MAGELNFGRDVDIQIHAFEVGHRFFRIFMLEFRRAAEPDPGGVVSPEMVDEFLPLTIDRRVPHSCHEVFGHVDFVGVDGHLQFVSLAPCICLSDCPFFAVGRIGELAEGC